MSFEKIAKDILVDCGRHCCICRTFCGTKIELNLTQEENEDFIQRFKTCFESKKE